MNNMTYEQYMELLNLGSENQGIDDAVALQLAQAKAIRPAPLEMRGNARIQTAPHWLELAGGLAQQYASKKLQDKSLGDLTKRRGNAQTQNSAIVRAIMGQRQPEVTQVPDNSTSANGLDY